MIKAAILAAGLAAGTAFGAGASTLSDPFTSFWALGDSLTDDGNAFAFSPSSIPSPPYFMGRVSNGRTYAEALAGDFEAQGKPAGNLAFAAAQAVANSDPIPDLGLQAFAPFPLYADGQPGLIGRVPQFGARPLVSIFIGSNDVLRALSRGEDPLAAAAAAARVIAETIAGLSPVAEDFLVFNLPDFAEIPRLNGAVEPVPEPVRELATASALAFQRVLDLELAALGPAVDVTRVDVFSALRDILADPAEYDLTNVTDPCLTFAEGPSGDPVLTGICPDPAAFAFYDEIHPTSTVHGALADAARASFVAAPIPLPASGWALLAGLGALAAVGRRRAAA